MPCTLLYGDGTMVLSLSGKLKNLKSRLRADFAQYLGLPSKTAATAIALALRAASSVLLDGLPLSGSPLRGAQRELRFRWAELTG